MPIHWAADDAPHFEYVRTETTFRQGPMNASVVGENWINDFLYMRDTVEWGALSYTCHPYVTGRGARMMMFERVNRAATDSGAAFLSMEEAAREFQERAG